jgi:hypothetical protein
VDLRESSAVDPWSTGDVEWPRTETPAAGGRAYVLYHPDLREAIALTRGYSFRTGVGGVLGREGYVRGTELTPAADFAWWPADTPFDRDALRVTVPPGWLEGAELLIFEWVIEETGTVRAVGTHAELVEGDDLYRDLAAGQLLTPETPDIPEGASARS